MESLIIKRDKLFSAHRYRDVIECCDTILEQKLDLTDETYYIKGMCWYIYDKYNQAVICFEQCKSVQGIFHSALCNHHIYKYKRAKEQYKEILQKTEPDTDFYIRAKRGIIDIILRHSHTKDDLEELWAAFPEYRDDINTFDDNTLLSIAIRDNMEIVDVLIDDLHANPFKVGKWDESAFSHAISYGTYQHIMKCINTLNINDKLGPCSKLATNHRYHYARYLMEENEGLFVSQIGYPHYEHCRDELSRKCESNTSQECNICAVAESISADLQVCINCYVKIINIKDKLNVIETCIFCGCDPEPTSICKKCHKVYNSIKNML